jgi:hypothetical protein
MSVTKTIVSISVDWSASRAIILPEFNLLEDLGVLRDNGDGSKELDVWYKSEIMKDRMVSSVVEFFSHPAQANGDFVRKQAVAYSTRYKNNMMLMDNTSYIKPTVTNNVVTGFEISKSADGETKHLIDDTTKEILDNTDPENPVSYTPKRYEQKIDTVNWKPMYTFFKTMTNIVSLMGQDMMSR